MTKLSKELTDAQAAKSAAETDLKQKKSELKRRAAEFEQLQSTKSELESSSASKLEVSAVQKQTFDLTPPSVCMCVVDIYATACRQGWSAHATCVAQHSTLQHTLMWLTHSISAILVLLTLLSVSNCKSAVSQVTAHCQPAVAATSL